MGYKYETDIIQTLTTKKKRLQPASLFDLRFFFLRFFNEDADVIRPGRAEWVMRGGT